MQFLIDFIKRIVSWATCIVCPAHIDPKLATILQDELQNIQSFIKNLKTELSAAQPFLKTIILSKINVNILKLQDQEIKKLKEPLKSKFLDCDQKMSQFFSQCEQYNQVFEKFVQIYIKNGLSLTGINQFDPQKMSAYKEVIEQYSYLMQSIKELQDRCRQALDALDVALREL